MRAIFVLFDNKFGTGKAGQESISLQNFSLMNAGI
jgi:hypothetical protein